MLRVTTCDEMKDLNSRTACPVRGLRQTSASYDRRSPSQHATGSRARNLANVDMPMNGHGTRHNGWLAKIAVTILSTTVSQLKFAEALLTPAAEAARRHGSSFMACSINCIK
jgi:hypothetical protein